MIIVAGHLTVDADRREFYLATCRSVVEAARRAPGCLDFAVTADLIEPDRVCIYERWESRAQLDDFRGSGPGDDQAREIRSMEVSEYLVPDVLPSNE
ncbi:antibiotic biosynthesis monooxygenase [Rhodococcus rhodochrous]|uniref:Antibiotic biosynthesis monooxygenase n=1 Tax=Rhodococcus rhodochrous TaxID=1829 RepID=A0AAW4XDP7_RHORH|nr:antibiotic biosynthesis monooxygenase family protein [Rhodococcus rhodochrous]MCD2111087.1 antibiotic biosynthesis monooxygenase [Rhodococcus rhodochrous]